MRRSSYYIAMNSIFSLFAFLILNTANAQVDCFFLPEAYTGVCETLYPDGKVKIRAELKDGQRHGMMSLLYPDGSKRADGYYQKDSLIYVVSYQYHPGKKIKWEMRTEKGLTSAKLFDEAGNLLQTCVVDHESRPQGEWIRYEAGQEIERVVMKDADEQTKSRFYPPGKPARMPSLRVMNPK